MELVVASVVLSVYILFVDISLEGLLIGTVGDADVVGDVVEVVIMVLVLVAALSVEALVVEILDLAVVGSIDEWLAEVIGVVDVVVVVRLLPFVDSVVLLADSGTESCIGKI